MKKLMIAAAAVLFGIAANAATYSWSGTINAYDWESDPGGPAAGFIQIFVNGVSQGTYDFDSNGDAKFSGIGLDAGDQVSAVATITSFKDGSGTMSWGEFDFSSAYIASMPSPTDAMQSMTVAAENGLTAGGTLDFSKTAAENGFAPVPEPTSGLLLLLGMAGLALRRRRV